MRALALTAVAVLATATAADAAAPPTAEYDRTCETHAEGPEPDDIALPDPKTDVIAGRVSIHHIRVAARDLKPYKTRDAYRLKTPVIIRSGAPVVVRVARR